MRIGISAYDMAAADILDLARAADRLGFDAIWLGEHLLLPVDYGSVHPTEASEGEQHHKGAIVDLNTELLDPFVALAAIAGATRRLRLATGIYILPLRHPLLTARGACTLQELSGGRLLLGLGTGWLVEEFAAFDVPFDERVSRFGETVEIMRRAWKGGPFEFRGKHFGFDSIQLTSRPTNVPLVFGGNTERALRRAATIGDAWFSSGTPKLDETVRLRDRLHAVRDEYGLTDPFPCYVRVEGADPAIIERYAREGIEDVTVWADQVWPPGAPLDVKLVTIERAAETLGLVSPVARSGERTASD
jgi:probable F420-dependent oxidoreductase